MGPLTLSNVITCLRAPLAFLFLVDNAFVRVTAIFLAMLSDGLDGYLARRFRTVTQLGTLLDPIMDKFFVLFAGSVLMAEARLQSWELLCLISRDFSVAAFGLYLVFTGRLAKVQFQSIWSGKVATLFQFGVLICLAGGLTIPAIFYSAFIVLALFALLELFLIHGLQPKPSEASD